MQLSSPISLGIARMLANEQEPLAIRGNWQISDAHAYLEQCLRLFEGSNSSQGNLCQKFIRLAVTFEDGKPPLGQIDDKELIQRLKHDSAMIAFRILCESQEVSHHLVGNYVVDRVTLCFDSGEFSVFDDPANMTPLEEFPIGEGGISRICSHLRGHHLTSPNVPEMVASMVTLVTPDLPKGSDPLLLKDTLAELSSGQMLAAALNIAPFILSPQDFASIAVAVFVEAVFKNLDTDLREQPSGLDEQLHRQLRDLIQAIGLNHDEYLQLFRNQILTRLKVEDANFTDPKSCQNLAALLANIVDTENERQEMLTFLELITASSAFEPRPWRIAIVEVCISDSPSSRFQEYIASILPQLLLEESTPASVQPFLDAAIRFFDDYGLDLFVKHTCLTLQGRFTNTDTNIHNGLVEIIARIVKGDIQRQMLEQFQGYELIDPVKYSTVYIKICLCMVGLTSTPGHWSPLLRSRKELAALIIQFFEDDTLQSKDSESGSNNFQITQRILSLLEE